MASRYDPPSTPLQSAVAGRTEADAVAEVAARAAQTTITDVPELPPGVLVADVGAGRNLEVRDLEEHLLTPRSKRGLVAATSPAALVEYVRQHQEEGTSVWSDRDAGRIVAVIDDHIPGGISSAPGWGAHRATLTLRHTPEWTHWLAKDGQLLSQEDFAEWLEASLPAIVSPPAAGLLEACRTLEIHREVMFSSADRPSSGEIRFAYQESDTARAGKSGEVELPDTVTLELAPWEGCEPVVLAARLRYRLTQGVLSLGYRLVRPHEVLRLAWDELVTAVGEGTQRFVFAGTPRV